MDSQNRGTLWHREWCRYIFSENKTVKEVREDYDFRRVMRYEDMKFSDEQIEECIKFYSVHKSRGKSHRVSGVYPYDRTAVTVPLSFGCDPIPNPVHDEAVKPPDPKVHGTSANTSELEEETSDVKDSSNDQDESKPTKAREWDGYLNANVVTDDKGLWWVAASAPLPGEFHTFFLAMMDRSATRIYEQLYPKSAAFKAGLPESPWREQSILTRHVILVQLTPWTEKGVPKADNYMPHEEGATLTFKSDHPRHKGHPAPSVDVELMCKRRHGDFVRSQLDVRFSHEKDQESSDTAITMWHFEYPFWPDGNTTNRKELDKLIRSVQTLQMRKSCEVWVHCSAGMGRTGTFMAAASLRYPYEDFDENDEMITWPKELPVSPMGPYPKDNPVEVLIDKMRDQRVLAVQNPSQVDMVRDFDPSQSHRYPW